MIVVLVLFLLIGFLILVIFIFNVKVLLGIIWCLKWYLLILVNKVILFLFFLLFKIVIVFVWVNVLVINMFGIIVYLGKCFWKNGLFFDICLIVI